MENKQPLVSVIMNCYNSDKYLNEAIDSVIVQTYQNWEIIFWDNQSTDKSADIVRSYNDERIKYFYAPKHTLLGEARNLAIDKAKGEWFGILDCDDVWYSNKLEVQLKNVSDDIGMIYSRAEFLIEGNGSNSYMAKSIKKSYYPKRKKLPSGDIFSELLYDCFIPLPSVLIKKSLFIKVGGIDGSLKVAEDYDIFLKIAHLFKVKSDDMILCKYRVHDNNLSHENIEVTFSESIALVSSYDKYPKINSYVLDWKMKHIKTLLVRMELKKAFIEFLSLNPFELFKIIIKN
ncbi:MAG: glycosyltransferase [Arcobacteraceae bacterium]|jgi:glycosyltransferase involved in cell wall biosynthesis|nr:glycosyltransferase [Arcobacteraceae bacterium]